MITRWQQGALGPIDQQRMMTLSSNDNDIKLQQNKILPVASNLQYGYQHIPFYSVRDILLYRIRLLKTATVLWRTFMYRPVMLSDSRLTNHRVNSYSILNSINIHFVYLTPSVNH